MLMDKQARQQSSKRRLSQLLLLLLRCLLIILAAILLAQPVWKKITTDRNVNGWVLLPKENLNETYRHFQQPIDSLLNASWELHFLEKGFKQAALKDSSDLQINENNVDNNWTLLSALDRKAPANIPVAIFTGNQLRKFRGSKPAVSRPVSWYTFTPADSIAEWNAYAWPVKSR